MKFELKPLEWRTNECGNLVADGYEGGYIYDPEEYELHLWSPHFGSYIGRLSKHLTEEAAKDRAWQSHTEAMIRALSTWVDFGKETEG